MKKKQFELDFDFLNATPQEAKAETRRRMFLGKISPQGGVGVLKSYVDDAKLEFLSIDTDLKRLKTYKDLGQDERVVAELDKKDTKLIGGKC